MKKRLLTLLLAICMVVTSVPVNAFAEEVQEVDVEVDVEDETATDVDVDVEDEIEADTDVEVEVEAEITEEEIVEEEATSKEAKNEVMSPEGVEINEDNFPDEQFREKWIVKYADSNADGILSSEEATRYTAIDLSGMDITSLKGIEHLTELVDLRCQNNEITSLDVSTLTKLEILYCYGNKLTEIAGLQNATGLREIYCYDNELTSLEVSGLANLVKIQAYNNKISGTLDLSGLTAVQSIDVQYNYLTGVVLDELAPFPILYVQNNHMTKEADVENNDRTRKFSFTPQGNGAVVINEENFPDPILREAVAYYDDDNDDIITTEDLRAYYKYTWDFSETSLTDLKGIELINEIHRIEELKCSDTLLKGEIDLSGFYELEVVDLSSTQVTGIKGLEDCEELYSLECSNSKLNGLLDVSMLTKLSTLYVQNNYLEKILFAEGQSVKNWDVSFNLLHTPDDMVNFVTTYYSGYYPQGNGSVEINETNFPDEVFRKHVAGFDRNSDGILTTEELDYWEKEDWELEESGVSSLQGIELINEVYRISGLYCGSNDLEGVLDVSALKSLSSLNCQENKITEIKGLENCKDLRYLRCFNNQLTKLDSLEGFSSLEYLFCQNNKITNLDGLESCTSLKYFQCQNNKIANLNGISECAKLISLQCYHNRITGTLDLSAASGLQTLYAWNNFLTKVVVDSESDSVDVNVKYNLLADRSAIEYDDRDGELEWLPQGNIEVEVSEENFPDDAFRAWVAKYDTDGNGFVNTPELDVDAYYDDNDNLTLERMYDLDGLGIADLTGIELLNNICEVTELHCSGNALTTLDVSSLTGMQSLVCSDNELEEITGLNYTNNLTYLNCGHNKLTVLDISELTQLKTLTINDNLFEGTLDISHIENDLRLDCEENYFTKVIVSDRVEYSELNLRYNVMENEDAVVNVDEEDNCYISPQINRRVELTEENFPDAGLRAVVATRDENKDGVVTTKEACEYTEGEHELDVSSRGVKSLQGMQLFYDVYPFEFFDCSQNEITGVLDLSKMPEVEYIDCSENKITGVILSEETDYKYFDMNFRYNQMSSKADVKGVSDDTKTYAYFWPQGEKLNVDINRMNFPDDVFRNYVIEEYDYDNDNVLSASEIEGAWHLWEWDTNGIKDFTGIEHLRALREVSLDSDDPVVGNLDALPDSVESFSCSNCNLMKLPKLPIGLTILYCSGNNLTELPVLPEGLEKLDCGDNKLKSLPTLPNTITDLECNDNLLEILPDLPNELVTFYFSDNKLTELPKLPGKLETMVGNYNELEQLPDLPDTLKKLEIRENKLTSLPELPDSLLDLDVYKNQLIELPKLPKYLSELNVHLNQLKELKDLPLYLETLYADHNQIEGILDVSNLTMLETLHVYDNKITGVKLCEDAKYKSIYLQSNFMNSLDDVTGDEGIVWGKNSFCFDSQKNLCERIGHEYEVNPYWNGQKASFDADGYGWLECSRCYIGKQDIVAKVNTPTFAQEEYTYTGKKITPAIEVTDANGKVLKKGTDYTVSGGYGTSPGRYSATVKLKGNYTGSKKIYFTIQPKAPSKVTATLSKYNSIKLSWSKCTGVKGYVVYYKTAGDEEYKKLTSTTKTYYTKSSLASGTEYEFKVVPRFKDGTSTVEGVNFKETSCWTLRKMDAPAVEKISDTKVRVSWDAVEGADGYSITYKTGKTSKTTTTTSGEKEITVKQNASYTYTVKAYKKVGSKKIYAPTSASTSYLLRYVGASSATTTEYLNENEVKFGWKKATGANAYHVFYKEQDAEEFTYVTLTEELSCTLSELEAGKTYIFKVVPCYVKDDVVELEGKETEALVYTMEQMDAPTVKRSTSTKVKVSWEKVEDKTGYQISQSTSETGTKIVSTYKTSTGSSKTISAPKNKTRYYKIRPYKIDGVNTIYGTWSSVAAFKNR